jgi:hypothetical protein
LRLTGMTFVALRPSASSFLNPWSFDLGGGKLKRRKRDG